MPELQYGCKNPRRDFVHGNREMHEQAHNRSKRHTLYTCTDRAAAETLRLKNEVGRMLDSTIIDKEPLKNRIFECASRRYDELDNGKRMTERIRAALEHTGQLSVYDKELMEKTVSAHYPPR